MKNANFGFKIRINQKTSTIVSQTKCRRFVAKTINAFALKLKLLPVYRLQQNSVDICGKYNYMKNKKDLQLNWLRNVPFCYTKR